MRSAKRFVFVPLALVLTACGSDTTTPPASGSVTDASSDGTSDALTAADSAQATDTAGATDTAIAPDAATGPNVSGQLVHAPYKPAAPNPLLSSHTGPAAQYSASCDLALL